MIAEQGTFDLGGEQRDAGAAKVAERLTPAERTEIITKLMEVARRSPTFTADNVRMVLSVGLCEKLDAFPNALGSIMLQCARSDLIEMTGSFAVTTRPERRHGRIAVWRLIAEEPR